MKTMLALALLLIATTADGAAWLNVGGVSWHPGTSGMNGLNNGLGLELNTRGNDFIAAGAYNNSIGEVSHYAVYGIELKRRHGLSAGFIAGVIDGYEVNDGGAAPLLLPFVTVRGKDTAVNVLAIPKIEGRTVTTFAVQFKLRIK